MTGELAGSLRERVTILRRGPERDALGGAAGAWEPVGEAWAAIVPEGRGVAVAGDVVAALPLWRVTLRLPSPAAMGDRIVWGGRRMLVRRVEADPRTPDRIGIVAEEER